MCKWNLHRGGDVGAMRTRWYGGGSEEELSGARRAEAGLCYRSESSNERGNDRDKRKYKKRIREYQKESIV